MQIKKRISFQLQSGQIAQGNVWHMTHLSAKFQIWCSKQGIDDYTSLAMWCSNQPEKHERYFNSGQEVLDLAKVGFEKIKGVVIPDLSDVESEKYNPNKQLNPIDFSKIEIDQNIVQEIFKIGNSCGMMNCYILSLVYGFNFDVTEFRNIGAGMSDSQIQEYAKRNGVNFTCKENSGNKSTCNYADFDTLCKNGILMTLTGTNTNMEMPHTSVVSDFNKHYFTQLWSNHFNCVTEFEKVENLYLTFYHKQDNISDFVTFK